jgi:hypothetical protein
MGAGLLMSSAAVAIGVGYLSVLAETGVQKLHEMPSLRRVVEAIFLFSLIDTIGQGELDLTAIFRWVVIALIAAVLLVGTISLISLSAFGDVVGILLFVLIVVVVLIAVARAAGRRV